MWRHLLIYSLWFIYIDAFINPPIKLDSGRKLTVCGNGPPLVFSTGLFGTMPRFLYSKFLKKLEKKTTVITVDGNIPLKKKDLYNIVEKLSVDSISYMSHSSFNPEVLECNKINKAILLDPICIPNFSINGVDKQSISLGYPTRIFKAEKLYNTDRGLPAWQDPEFTGEVIESIILDVGHPDILDNTWANFAKQYGFWDTSTGEIIEYKKWRLDKIKTINKSRDKYRDYLSRECLQFFD